MKLRARSNVTRQLLAAFLLLCGSSLASAQSWVSVAPWPTPRLSFGTATSNGRIYAIGGYYLDNSEGLPRAVYSSQTDVYDPITNTWQTRASMPTPRAFLNVVATPDGRVYAIGGGNLAGPFLDTVERYDPTTDRWETLSPMPSGHNGAMAAVGIDGMIYVFGGDASTTSGSVTRYDPSTNTWQSLDPVPLFAPIRQGVAATAADGRIYLAGGFDVSMTSYQVWAYDPASNTWSPKAQLPEYGVYEPAGAMGADGRFYVLGGINVFGFVVNTAYAYDAATDTWTTLPSLPSTRYSLKAAAAGDYIYALRWMHFRPLPWSPICPLPRPIPATLSKDTRQTTQSL
jgi:N-acetylneuraminic acid mutarotase